MGEILTNPVTGIRYDSVSLLSIDRFMVTQGEEIDKPTAVNVRWPALEGNAYVGGFAPGERWWKIVQSTLPTADFRYRYVDTAAAAPADPPAPIGHPSGTWETTRELVPLDNDTLFGMIESRMALANGTIYHASDDPANRALVDNARSRQAQGIADETDLLVLARDAERVGKLKDNLQNAETMKVAVLAGTGWDIEAGWKVGNASPEIQV